MLPAAARTPSDFKEVAVNDVVAAQRQLQTGLDQLLGPGGRLEQQTAAIAAVVDNAAAKWDGTYRLLVGEIQIFRQQSEAKDREQDGKLERLTRELSELRGRIDTLERTRGTDGELGEVKSILNELVLRFDLIDPNARQSKTTLTGRVVLVVENEDALVRTLRRLLESRGATVLTARDFSELKSALVVATPDCVLLDIRLSAEDGLEIAKWLIAGKRVSHGRILLLTGHADAAHQAAAQSLGLVVLEKPIASAELIDAIVASLETPAS
jgi:ActR/RegA family two-component response regulator